MELTFSEHMGFLLGCIFVCYIPYIMDRNGYRKEEDFSPWVPLYAGIFFFAMLELVYWVLELIS